MSIDFKWDQKLFDAILVDYLRVTKKDVASVLNKKALSVAYGSMYNTQKAKLSKIRAYKTKKFKRKDRKQRGLMMAAMLQNRMKAKNRPGLNREDMADMMKRVYNARAKSIAFIKSGWLHAIKKMSTMVPDKKGIVSDEMPNPTSRRLGNAIAASENSLSAQIENAAIAKHDKKNALEKYGTDGLNKGFAKEALSMQGHIESVMAKRANEFNKML